MNPVTQYSKVLYRVYVTRHLEKVIVRDDLNAVLNYCKESQSQDEPCIQ